MAVGQIFGVNHMSSPKSPDLFVLFFFEPGMMLH